MNLKVKQNTDVNPLAEEGEGKGLKRSTINGIVKKNKLEKEKVESEGKGRTMDWGG